MKEELRLIELNEDDVALIMRAEDNSLELQYPASGEEFVNPIHVPILAITLLYGSLEAEDLPEDRLIYEVLYEYILNKLDGISE